MATTTNAPVSQSVISAANNVLFSPLPGTQVTSEVWAAALISILPGVSMTQNNITNVQKWMQLEGPGSTFLANGAYVNNPLNIRPNGAPGAFPTIADGIGATASVIKQGNMSAILGALKANASWPTFSAALVNSPWDGGHYGGSASKLSGATAQNGAGANSASSGTLSSLNPLSGLSGLESGVNTVLTDLTSASWWKRIGIFTLGGAFLIIGLVVFNKDSIEATAGTVAKGAV